MSSVAISGMLDVETFKAEVANGDIKTVITVFPDMYGRLLGKRITGDYFLNDVLGDAIHACDYLFTVDMEMDPIPGYQLSSWETGFGDVRCVPDLATLRRAAWLDKTAVVLCDVLHETKDTPVSIAPRNVRR